MPEPGTSNHAGRTPGDFQILVVDDDTAQRSLLESFLAAHEFNIRTAASAEDAEASVRENPPAMVISDVRMPGMSGLDLLRHVLQTRPGLPVLLVTAYADVRDAVGAMREGAVDYLEKPIDLDELLDTVRETLGLRQDGRGAVPHARSIPAGVVARSPAMAAVIDTAALVAASDSRVLITGESGVGKEVVANVIHALSPRSGGPFVKVNCAAIPETLMESELFGHEKGAFTGAAGQRAGYFEQADGGTILLDEIGELAPPMQAKLLRVIQDGCFRRIGAAGTLRADTRILVATNCDLEEAMLGGRFREDLYYRLNVFEIHVPPLRERTADILPLAKQFLADFCKGRPRFSPEAAACVERYGWPGNVRELRNAVERASLLARGEVILPEYLPPRVRGMDAPNPAAGEAPAPANMADIEREAILRVLREHGHNRTVAARALGISRRALTYKVREYRAQGHDVDG